MERLQVFNIFADTNCENREVEFYQPARRQRRLLAEPSSFVTTNPVNLTILERFQLEELHSVRLSHQNKNDLMRN